MKIVQKNFFLLIGLMACSCTSSPSIEARFAALDTISRQIVITNDLAISNTPNGHIQGVQYFATGDQKYYFLSGSSDSLSYYAIADASTKEVIHVDTFFVGQLRHPGGFQIADRLLAVGVEDNVRKDRSKVCLYELVGPANKKLKLLKTIDRSGPEKRYTAGCVALSQWEDQLIIAAGNWDTKNMEFYTLPADQLYNLKSQFQEVFSFDTQTADRSTWSDTTWYAYQSINFLSDQNGLYLVGTAKKDSSDFEVIDWYKVNDPTQNAFQLQKIGQQIFLNADTTTTFKWGGGIHQAPTGNIRIFSTSRNIKDALIISYISF